jgi:hypothetical protein
LLKIFNYQAGTLKYHEKIRKKIFNHLHSLPEEFWETNPIISGGYAIHLLFKPLSSYDDIDFYFHSEEDFNSAYNILHAISEDKTSVNSKTFLINNVKIQLINKFFDSPENIVYMHDFYNSSICITKDNIILDDILFKLYNDSELSIRDTQISDSMSMDSKLKKIGVLFNRVLKYQDRYDLSLSKDTLSILVELTAFAKKAGTKTTDKIFVDSGIYYNGTYNPSQNNLVSITEIVNKVSWVIKENLVTPYDSQYSL